MRRGRACGFGRDFYAASRGHRRRACCRLSGGRSDYHDFHRLVVRNRRRYALGGYVANTLSSATAYRDGQCFPSDGHRSCADGAEAGSDTALERRLLGSVATSPALLLVLLVTVLNGTGQFTFFTYFNPSLKASLGASMADDDLRSAMVRRIGDGGQYHRLPVLSRIGPGAFGI